MTYAFADFELDPSRAELRQNGLPVPVEPQVFDLLKLLVSSHGRMVPRDEIFAAIWGDRVVSDAALSSRIKDARKALGDDGSTQKFIKTVQRRGLLFVGQVTSGTAAAQEPAPVAVQRAAAENHRAKVAVLPVEDIAIDGGATPFTRALTDELTAALACWRTFLVVSGQSVARLPSDLVSVPEIGAVLGADYLLRIAIRHSGSKIKANMTLTQVDQNTDVWSDRIACNLEELVDVEEEIAQRMSTLLATEIQMSEVRRIMRKPEAAWTPWEKAMRAISYLRNGRRSDLLAAEDIANRAAEETPDWGLPFALVAMARFQMAMAGFSASDTSQAFRPALEAAEVALDIDRTDWMAHALTAVGELWTNRHHDKAIEHVKRALELNPSAVINYHFGGCITGFAGDPAQARAYQEHLIRIDPTYPYRAVIEADLGLWYMLDGEYDKAESRFDHAETWDPDYGRTLQRRIALFGLKGDRDRAQAAATRLKELQLPVDIDTIAASYPFRLAKHRDVFLTGLRQAGLNL